MKARFEFDKRGAERVVNAGMNKIAAEAQGVFDALMDERKGRPADEVVRHVRQAFSRLQWRADGDDVREYAKAISQGERIVFNAKRVRL